MIVRSSLSWYRIVWQSLTAVVLWASCSAQAPEASQNSVDLPFGDINVLVLTDVHSFVGGHGPNDHDNADYGDVLSFYQHLKEHCRQRNMDLWFVNNGDWIDGTGLSMNSDIQHLTPLLEKMPWDAMNVGNHELYKSQTVTEFMQPGGFVEWWGDKYLSSNVLYTQRQEPLGQRYRFLKGTNSTVLTFGFLYNMEDASPLVTVKKVQKVVEEQWFLDVVGSSNMYDAILVLAHMDVGDALVSVLLEKIRSIAGNLMPVQFITGHTHYRGIQTMDEASVSFEAGRYLDTIGFVSFPKKQNLVKISNTRMLQEGERGDDESEGESQPLLGPGGTEWANVSDSSMGGNLTTTAPTDKATTRATISPTPSPSKLPGNNNNSNPPATNNTSTPNTVTTPTPTPPPTQVKANQFLQKFIDANVATLESILGIPDISTEDGTSLSEFIKRTRGELGLLALVGCAPESYYIDRSVADEDSLWRVFLDDIAPFELLKPSSSTGPNQRRMFLGDSGELRYDVAEGKMIKDDVIAVTPFNDTVFSLGPDVPGSVVIQLVNFLNDEPSLENEKWEKYVLSPSLDDLESDLLYEIMAPEFSVKTIINGLEQIGYNGTVGQTDSGFRSTNIWLDFVQDQWKCKTPEKSPPGNGHSNHNNQNHNSGSSSTSGSGAGGGGSGAGDHTHTSGTPYIPGGAGTEDKFRLTLAGIGIGAVLILGSVYIWQLHKTYMVRYRDRQRIIFLADQEHDNELI